MEPFRWILLLIGGALLFSIFAYSRGWYPRKSGGKTSAASPDDSLPDDESRADEAVARQISGPKPMLESNSKVLAVRIMPRQGEAFPAEELILALRSAGFRHGQFGIFHYHDTADDAVDNTRVRFSVASLVEPGSFDLSKLSESKYSGVSIFTVLPAPEDGASLFDGMINKAREIARDIDGKLMDEQGGAFSLQRECYMREELVEFLRQLEVSAGAAEGSS
jgi:cell division protein ZipA